MVIKEFFALLGIEVDDGAFSKADSALDTVKSGLTVVAGVAAATGAALAVMVHGVAEQGAEFSKLSQVMGVSAEEAQRWAYAAGVAGVETNDLIELAAELAENVGEASSGTGEAADAFKSLGIATKDAKGKLKEVPQLLGEIADKFASMPDGQAKAAATTGLFGESGLKLLPILNQGAAGISNLMTEADALGVVLDGSTIQQSAELNRQFTTLGKVTESLKNSIAAEFLPVILELTQGFLAWWKLNSALTKQRMNKIFALISPVLSVLVGALKLMGFTLGFVIDNWKLFALLLMGAVYAALTTISAEVIFLGVESVIAAASSAAAWVVAALPMIAMAAAVALLLLLLEDVYGFFSGNDSFIGSVIEQWATSWSAWMAEFTTINPGDPWWLVAIKEALRVAKELLDTLVKLDPKRVIEAPRQVVEGLSHWWNTTQDQRDKEMQQQAFDASPERRAKVGKDAAALWSGLGTIGKAAGVGDFSQSALQSSSVAGASAISSTKSSAATTNNVTATITVDGSKSPEATVKAIDDWFTGVLGEAKATK